MTDLFLMLHSFSNGYASREWFEFFRLQGGRFFDGLGKARLWILRLLDILSP
jgi:hypothetical protein